MMIKARSVVLGCAVVVALAACHRAAPSAPDAGKAFLAQNAQAGGVHVTASGLHTASSGPAPRPGCVPSPPTK
jgi:hypothetical protein